MMSNDHCHQSFIKCPDCSFIAQSQGGLGVHRLKRHKVIIPDNVKCHLFMLNVSFPKGRLLEGHLLE
jgi:hypothetical protein